MQKFVLDRRKRKMPVNPSIEFADAMVEEARNCDEVVSIGGGSTIDVGKYVSWSLGLPHTAIPTTAGSGSEVTHYAVLLNDNGQKRTMRDPALLPDSHILDPRLVVSLPPVQTASSGMDAVSQAIESYWSAKAIPASREMARIAIRLGMTNLYLSYKNPNDLCLRMNMLMAANLSGRSIGITGTNVCHAVSYPLTRLYGIPHGLTCALTLAEWIRFFDGNDECADWDKWVDDALRMMDGHSCMPDMNYAVPDRDIAFIAEEAMSYESIQTGPKRVTLQDVRMILEKSLCA